MLLGDGRGWDVVPSSEKELVSALRKFHTAFRSEGEPRIAVIWLNPDDDEPPHLSIGLGADECVVCYDDLSNGESWCARGRRLSTEEICFAYGTDYSYFAKWMLIRRETAFAAAAEFFRSGRRPSNLEWRDVAWQPPRRRPTPRRPRSR